ncbi:O-antigen ligase family protein [Xylophilus sp. GOD-11R]|uniref:O-antigen ligase family protein n=1 Tax=Xylophilus sp. GOD-11R TaxID=3089814 RepID=UPI00298D2D59|nr:O-antigen ligase family protein [Xylophilus sp. GOD-11R]WPB56821.1 O-antigen ligase family protein [Xylophilus sp. GOD-11R]
MARPAAALWGAVVFMPVGVNYGAFILLWLAFLVGGDWRERAQRVRHHPLWWPVVFYMAWTLLVLAFGKHYPQTPGNTLHGLRIAATVLAALALTRDETVWALRAFLAMAVAGLVLIGLHALIGFPPFPPFDALLELVGNKSISNALLLTIVATGAALLGFEALHGPHRWRAVIAFGVVAAVLAVISQTLPSRTSMLGFLLAMVLAGLHRWRRELRSFALALLLGGAVIGVAVWQSPTVQQRFEKGVQEIEAAQAGAVSEGSWVVRFYMYRDTALMMADRPIFGWGIGGWTEQWHLRGPKLLADYNMPHNDFLWMGSQAGVPGAFSLLLIMIVGLRQAWRRQDLTGRFAFAAMVVLTVGTSLNSALRDAQIGLSLLWVAMLYLRCVQEPGEPWRNVLTLSGRAPRLHRP